MKVKSGLYSNEIEDSYVADGHSKKKTNSQKLELGYHFNFVRFMLKKFHTLFRFDLHVV